MTGIMEWVKNYSMLFLLLTVITSLTVKKEYKRYIHFFAELLLVVSIASPVLKVMGREEAFFDKISYDSFWQGLDTIRIDQKKVEFLQDEYYIEYYEKLIAADVTQMAKDAGYEAVWVKTVMSDSYEVEKISMEVESILQNEELNAHIFSDGQNPDLKNLQEKIAAYYQMQEAQVEIIAAGS